MDKIAYSVKQVNKPQQRVLTSPFVFVSIPQTCNLVAEMTPAPELGTAQCPCPALVEATTFNNSITSVCHLPLVRRCLSGDLILSGYNSYTIEQGWL